MHWKAAPPRPLDELNAKLVLTKEEFLVTLPSVSVFKMAFDIETSSLSCEEGRIVGFSYSFDGINGWYVPVEHQIGRNNHIRENPVDAIKIIYNLIKKSKVVYTYNSRFEMRWMEYYGYPMRDIHVFDVMKLVFNMDTNIKENDLKWASQHYLGYKQPTYEDTLGSAENFGFLDPAVAYFYGAMDSILTYALAMHLGPKMMKECPVIIKLDNTQSYPLMKMEDQKIDLDLNKLTTLYDEISSKTEIVQSEAWSIAGQHFNLGSGKQVSDVLMLMGISTGATTKTGYMQTNQDVLEKVDHPLAKKVVKYRQLLKLRTSYVEVLQKAAKEGNVRFNYLDCHVPTGRYAASGDKKNPYFAHINIQSLPKNDSKMFNVYLTFEPDSIYGYKFSIDPVEQSLGEVEGYDPKLNIRSAFRAPDGFYFFHIDYSGQELRIAACMSGEQHWIQAYKDNDDIHKRTAILVWGADAYNRDKRFIAKKINFGAMYGGNAQTIANQTGYSREESQTFLNGWMRALPQLVAWIDYMHRLGRKQGTVYTAFGRPRRVFEYFNSSEKSMIGFGYRTSVNTVVQGCLQSHVRILTDHGYIPIKELYDINTDGWRVWTGTKWAIFEVLNRGKARLANLKMADGHILDCDTRHEVLCHTMRGNSIFKKVMELSKNRRVCSIKPEPLDFGSIPNCGDFPPEELFYWIGRHIGDGYYRNDKVNHKYDWTIYFSIHEMDCAERFVNFIEMQGYCVYSRDHQNDIGGKTHSVQVSSRRIIDLLSTLGVEKGTAKTKRIPEPVWRASLGLRQSFIKGLMDADGYWAEHSIHLMNHELLKEFQLLCEVSQYGKPRLRGPFACGSSTLQLRSNKTGCSRLDSNYSYSNKVALEVQDIYEETYTLSVDDEGHRFVSDGIISKNTGADLMRRFIPKIYNIMERYPNDVKFVSMIHDEYNMMIRKSVSDELIPMTLEAATFRHPDWPIPITCDFELGYSWGELFPFKFNKEGRIVPDIEE